MKITKSKSGKYTTVIAMRDEQGNRHMKRFTASTKKEVQTMAVEYQTIHTVYRKSMAFGDCLERYIEKKRSVLSPSTMYGYCMYQKVLTEQYKSFCALPLDSITKTVIQNFIVDFSKGRKYKTIKNYISLISAVLQDNDYRMPNYDIPKDIEKFTANVPTNEVVAKVAKAAEGTEWELPFALACMGLRRSEIIAATADDLSSDNMLHIRHAVVRGDDMLYHKKNTKTDESDRFILLPEQVADLLRKNGRTWKKKPMTLTNNFHKLLDMAGVEHFRLHDCRHFFASYCHDVLKLSDAQIQRLGGWKTDYVMKRVYITSITDETKNVQNAFSDLLQKRNK